MLLQVMKKAHVARQRLLRLGIFKEVEVLIDTSEGNGLDSRSAGSHRGCDRVASISGSDALPNGLDVTFEVTEIKRLTGSYNTMVGNNEGSMVRRAHQTPCKLFGGIHDVEHGVPQVLGLKLPNMLGRAEKLTFQFSYGTKETSYGLSFFKPQPGSFERK